MRYYLDTEFLVDWPRLDLLSLAVVADNGREYYAVVTDDLSDIAERAKRANPWLWEHVLPQVLPWETRAKADPDSRWRTRAEIVDELRAFVQRPTEFWAYYAAYDWVLVCELMGGVPEVSRLGWPNWINDLRQRGWERGHRVMADPPPWHHALRDARWVRAHPLLTRAGG